MESEAVFAASRWNARRASATKDMLTRKNLCMPPGAMMYLNYPRSLGARGGEVVPASLAVLGHSAAAANNSDLMNATQ